MGYEEGTVMEITVERITVDGKVNEYCEVRRDRIIRERKERVGRW